MTSKINTLSLLAVIVLTGVISAIGLGCTTTRTVTTLPDGTTVTNVTTTADLNRITNAINNTIPGVVRIAVNKAPQARQPLLEAAAAIDLLVGGTEFDPEALNGILSARLKTSDPDLLAVIDTAVGLYKSYYGDVIAEKLPQKEWLVPVLRSLSVSIRKGLAQ